MARIKNSLFYIVTICLFGLLLYYIFLEGRTLESSNIPVTPPAQENSSEVFAESFIHNLKHPLAILILQIISIVMVARAFGYVFKKLGQPSVIGEIVAGIVLGPSLVGLYFPSLSAFLFPAASLGNLQFLSQIGLILFMFVIGMELDLSVLKKRAHEAIVISHASIIIPYALGTGLAFYLYKTYAPDGINFLSFGLFMGIAMSITAFPVLARIVQEKGLTRTKLGTIAITCAAADDITAWCILAAVIAIVKAGTFISALYTIALALLYVLAMLFLVRPFMNRMGQIYAGKEKFSKAIIALVFAILLISSYATEIIGIHALFGAFLAGVIMPPAFSFRKVMIDKVEDVSTILFLPLFFVFTGLRTQIGLLDSPDMWLTCGLIVLVAVAGKFAGSALAAKIVGQNWRDSLAIGALMNTRGLMELIVLNIGFDLGILSAEIFAMLVLMALVTTFMTGPALKLIDLIFGKSADEIKSTQDLKHYQVTIPYTDPSSAEKLLRLASYLCGESKNHTAVHAVKLANVEETSTLEFSDAEKVNERFIKQEENKLQIPIHTEYKLVHDIEKEISMLSRQHKQDLLLIDAGQSIYTGTLLGNIMRLTNNVLSPELLLDTITGKRKLLPADLQMDEKAQTYLEDALCTVGVLIDKNFHEADHIMIPLFGAEDAFLVNYARKLLQNNPGKVNILDMAELTRFMPQLFSELQQLKHEFPQQVNVISGKIIDQAMLLEYDLILVSYNSWLRLVYGKSIWLTHIPSTLVIKPTQGELLTAAFPVQEIKIN